MEELNFSEIAKKHMYMMNNMDINPFDEQTSSRYNNNNLETYKADNQIITNKDGLISINSNYTSYFGEFTENWRECKTDEDFSYWYNEKINKSVWDNPLFIHLCLVENKIDKSWVPVYWKSFNDKFIKIKFINKRKLFIDRVQRRVIEKVVSELEEKKNNASVIPEGMVSGQRYIKQYVLEKVRDKINEGLEKQFELEDEEDDDDFDKNEIEDENNLEHHKKKEDIRIIEDKSSLISDKNNLIPSQDFTPKLDSKVEAIYDGQNNQYEKETKDFKELLKEKNIGLNAVYQKELPKIVYEERYKNLPQELRKKVFDEYVKEYLPKQKQQTAIERKKNQEKLKNLLNEMIEKSIITLKTTMNEFKELMKDNDTYNCNTQMDRDFLFNESKLKIKRIEEESIEIII